MAERRLTGSTLRIGDTDVRPGQRVSIDLPVPPLYTHTAMSMPVHVINGRRPGPRLFVCAALHGDEINGVEIIRRLLNHLAERSVHGALVAVPVVNVYGFISQSRYLPDRRDLNRSFPGSERGSTAARLANLFMMKIASVCTHGIDLHTGAQHRDNLPQIRASIDDHPATERLARAFGAPVIINADVRDGSLRQAVKELGIPMLLYEAGEALRFDEVAIRAGLKGILSVMRQLGMLPVRARRKKAAEPFMARSSQWVRAPQSGILRAITPLGARIGKGDVLGVVADPFGRHEEAVVASATGIVIGKSNLPLVNEGEALFHIARFERPISAAAAVEVFQTEHDPSADLRPPEEPPIV
jgi:predicted deacylase